MLSNTHTTASFRMTEQCCTLTYAIPYDDATYDVLFHSYFPNNFTYVYLLLFSSSNVIDVFFVNLQFYCK